MDYVVVIFFMFEKYLCKYYFCKNTEKSINDRFLILLINELKYFLVIFFLYMIFYFDIEKYLINIKWYRYFNFIYHK